MEFAERVNSLTPEGAYFVLAKAQALEAQGRPIIHLEIGQPDNLMEDHVVEPLRLVDDEQHLLVS